MRIIWCHGMKEEKEKKKKIMLRKWPNIDRTNSPICGRSTYLICGVGAVEGGREGNNCGTIMKTTTTTYIHSW